MGVDLVDITAKRAALTPHAIAFEDAITGRTLTYARLEDRCIARGGRARRVRRRRAAIASPSSAATASSFSKSCSRAPSSARSSRR